MGGGGGVHAYRKKNKRCSLGRRKRILLNDSPTLPYIQLDTTKPGDTHSHLLLTQSADKLQPGNKYFSSARGTLPCSVCLWECACVRVCVCQLQQGYWVCLSCGREENTQLHFLLVGHTYLNCRAVTQHQGPGGPGSPTWGGRRRWGSGDRHLKVGVFLHQCYVTWQITPAVRQGPATQGAGGPERKRTVVTVVRRLPPLHPPTLSADDDEVEEEEKKHRAGQEKRNDKSRAYMKKRGKIPDTFTLFPVSNSLAPLLLLPPPPPPFLH